MNIWKFPLTNSTFEFFFGVALKLKIAIIEFVNRNQTRKYLRRHNSRFQKFLNHKIKKFSLYRLFQYILQQQIYKQFIRILNIFTKFKQNIFVLIFKDFISFLFLLNENQTNI